MQELSAASVLLVDGQTVGSPLKANILLVDDSPTKLLALESALASLGQNLLTARSADEALRYLLAHEIAQGLIGRTGRQDRKSTRLNSSHLGISYAVFCLKTKKHMTANL